MESKALAKPEWQSILDELSKTRSAAKATLLVSSEAVGVQTEAENVRFLGISYDPKDDAVSIEVEGLDHRISSPTDIAIAFDGNDLNSIEIKADENMRHIVSFTPAISFPLIEKL